MKITAELPLEIIESEILTRLPVKSLGRFMCVCKQWRSFLSTPQFARMQQLHHHKLLLLDSPRHSFCTIDCEAPNDGGSTITRSIPFEADLISDVMVLASFDGLVCVTICKTHKLVFWNPLTGAYKKLSANTNHHDFYDISSDAIGFYSDSSNDYKLLHMVPKGAALGAYVFSWREDAWRMIQSLDNIQHLSTYRWSSPATFSGESLYFMVMDESVGGQSHIIVFDVKSETFRELRFPHVANGNGAVFWGSLVVVNGHIHLCVSYKMEGNFVMPSRIDMWRMDCDGWMKVAAFSYVQGIPLALRPVYVMRNGNWLAVQRDGNHVYKIDLKNFERERVSFYGGDWVPLFQRAIYVQTLVSPNP